MAFEHLRSVQISFEKQDKEFTEFQSPNGLEIVAKWDSPWLIDIGMRENARKCRWKLDLMRVVKVLGSG